MYNLHQSIRKHGWNAFNVEVIYSSKDMLHTKNVMEPYFIKEYQTYGKGYNMTPGGNGSPCTPEKAANISKALKTTYRGAAGQSGNQSGKDQLWFTNGTITIKVHKNSQPPQGFIRGRTLGKQQTKRVNQRRPKFPNGYRTTAKYPSSEVL